MDRVCTQSKLSIGRRPRSVFPVAFSHDQMSHRSAYRTIPERLDQFPIGTFCFRIARTINEPFSISPIQAWPWMLRRGSKKVFDMSKTFFDRLRRIRTVPNSAINQEPVPDLPDWPRTVSRSPKWIGKMLYFLDRGLDREPDRICERGA